MPKELKLSFQVFDANFPYLDIEVEVKGALTRTEIDNTSDLLILLLYEYSPHSVPASIRGFYALESEGRRNTIKRIKEQLGIEPLDI